MFNLNCIEIFEAITKRKVSATGKGELSCQKQMQLAQEELQRKEQQLLAVQQALAAERQHSQELTTQLRKTVEQLQAEIGKSQRGEKERLQVLCQEQAAHTDKEVISKAAQNQIINILERITDAFFAVDNEWRFTYINPKAEPFIQRRREELIGKNLWEEFPEVVGSTFYYEYYKAVSQQVSVEFQEFYPPLNKWFEVRAYPSPEGLSVYYQDISERKLANEALQQSEQQLRAIFEGVAIGVALTSLDGRLLESNPKLSQMLGYSQQELQNKPFTLLTHPDDIDSDVQLFQELVAGERDAYQLEKRYIRKDGQLIWGLLTVSLIRGCEGEPEFSIAMVKDITERKQQEEDAHFLESMKQAVFESQDFHMALQNTLQKVCEATNWEFGEAWVPRFDQSILECSPAWYSCVDNLEAFRNASKGLTFAPGVGIPGRVWVSKQPEWRRDVSIESNQVYLRTQIAMECGLKAALGVPIIANDGVIAILVFYMFESHDEDQRLIDLISASTELGLFIQRKQAEEEVHKSLQKEKELSELKSRFISMASHEFRTPLSSISLSAEILKKYEDRLTPEKKLTHLHRIQTAVQRMTGLLDDVLLIGKVDAGRMEFNPTPLALKPFCQDLIAEIELLATAQHTMVFENQGEYIEAGTGALPLLDEKILRHILTNLLSNAIKYSPEGGMIKFELACQDGEAVFRIQDQGLGISAEDQKRLFETFHRGSNVGNIPGTGLGLSIIKKFVDLHQGQITVDSQLGVGTTVTVKFLLHYNSSK